MPKLKPDGSVGHVDFEVPREVKQKLRLMGAERETTANLFARQVVLEAVYARFPELRPQPQEDRPE